MITTDGVVENAMPVSGVEVQAWQVGVVVKLTEAAAALCMLCAAVTAGVVENATAAAALFPLVFANAVAAGETCREIPKGENRVSQTAQAVENATAAVPTCPVFVPSPGLVEKAAATDILRPILSAVAGEVEKAAAAVPISFSPSFSLIVTQLSPSAAAVGPS